MVTLTIDNRQVTVENGTTILAAAQKLGIKIPTLCYMKDIHEIGACRVCVVEIEGQQNLSAACNTEVADGMVIHTASPRVLDARRTNVELILSKHNVACTTCVRSGNCSLQTVANELNLISEPFEKSPLPDKWDSNSPLIRDASKCIQCLRCVTVCDKIQGLRVWEVQGTGSRTKIGVRGGTSFSDINCALCGQCITHCPVGALHERDDSKKLFDAIRDPEKVVVAQVAPAVRAAWGDGLGLDAKIATEKRMVAAIRALGVDYVFDTNWSADLTIMEEGSEFLHRMTNPGSAPMPMFTSCCPGWVRFMKFEYPELAHNLSSAKSPQQMFGAVAKSYFAEKIGVAPEKIFCVSLMPCTAKKYECDVPEVNDAAGKDVDMVLTTREFDRVLKLRNVNVEALPEEEFDSPLGDGSGAAVIFGVTGGVMEAALRSAYFLMTGENPKADAFKDVRGETGWRSSVFEVNGIKLRLAVASGLANARALIEAIKDGSAQYDFVEIMACPGGCAGGGGQPICDGFELAGERGEKLYELDRNNAIRFSHENPSVQTIYKEYLEKPLAHKAHELLHTNQEEWSIK